ncbi:hypothetical protein I5M27_18455 [Adhaeribacter sp. BT258]|uniref:Uncharacterized protein n=1 Tax=Adhaeribacter terrigena TaxID=2793070 RepID=A0ABS1C8H1_9BACT|nr:contact-dependent growth inhibition system immunity protein [Adhaeribacter terrigena]MBK0404973.1 hypothetical protein [Adhaeribacter terrigena]
MDLKEKSIQELENDYWPDQSNYPTGLVERCHNFRKIKIKDLQIHQIITLLIQDIGSDFLMPIVLEKMGSNILEEDDFDGSSFIESLEFFSNEIFKRNPQYLNAILDLIERKKEEIEIEKGSKYYEQIVKRITNHNKS